jgi:hypothetical protein
MAVAMNAGVLRGAQAVEAGGAATESMGGVAVIVLSILALVGVVPRILVPIAGIVFGIAFMVEGAALAARQATLLQQTERTGTAGQEIEIGGGVTIELTVGAAAIVLGILSLIGIVPGILMSALVTAAGAGLIVSSGSVQRLNEVQVGLASPEFAAQRASVARIATTSAAGAQFLAGVAVTVLGILGLTGKGAPLLMSSVGLLVLGCAITLSGTALASRMVKLVQGGRGYTAGERT